MKNQLLRIARFLPLWGILFSIGFIVSGCSSSVTGRVFFDQNNNGEYDTTEPGVPFVKMMITVDGEKNAEGNTDVYGRFKTTLKKRSGKICFKIDNQSLTDVEESVGANLSISKAAVLGTPTASADEDEEIEEKEETESDTSDAEEDKPATTKPTTTAPAAPPIPAAWTTDGYCETLKKGSGTYSKNIPIPVEAEGGISDLPDKVKQTCYAGEDCEISLPFTSGCTFKKPDPPAGLTYTASTSATVSKSMKALETDSDAPSVSVSQFEVQVLKFKVNNDIELGTTEVTIQAKEDCAGTIVNLQPAPIELVREVKVDVRLALKDGEVPGAGKETTFIATVKNKGKSMLKEGYLVVELPDGISFDRADHDCDNLGEKARCKIVDLKSQDVPEKIEIRTKKFPATLDEDRTFEIAASLTSDELKEDFIAVPIQFTLPKTPAAQ